MIISLYGVEVIVNEQDEKSLCSFRHRACQAIVPHGTMAMINILAANKNQIAWRLPNLNKCSANELKSFFTENISLAITKDINGAFFVIFVRNL